MKNVHYHFQIKIFISLNFFKVKFNFLFIENGDLMSFIKYVLNRIESTCQFKNSKVAQKGGKKLLQFKFSINSMKLLKTFIIGLLFYVLIPSVNATLNEFKNWKQMDFQFPSPAIRQQAINEGKFVPASIIPIDVAVDYQSKHYDKFN